MLDFDYQQHYAALIQKTSWSITLPKTWGDYFDKNGVSSSLPSELRGSQRRNVRTCGVLRIDGPLRAIPRNTVFFGIFTKDFSKNAVGLISPIQLFPTERLRMLLPTFWLSLEVIRCERHNSHCYEVGTKLLHNHDVDMSAFCD